VNARAGGARHVGAIVDRAAQAVQPVSSSDSSFTQNLRRVARTIRSAALAIPCRRFACGASARARHPLERSMATFRCELDAPNNIVMVMVTEDDGSEHDYQFDFDPRSGRYEFSERDILERDFGVEWVDEMEAAVKGLIDKAVAGRQ